MAQTKPQWQEIDEFNGIVRKLAAKYPSEFDHVEPDKIIAYQIINKERPTGKAKPYDMKGSPEPESFTNSKSYFVKMFQEDWDEKTVEQKIAMVFSVLCRIDRDNPGKVGPLDYRDQSRMVKTFGPDWQLRGDLPNLLEDNVDFKE